MKRRGEVAVGVQRQPNGAMPEQILDDLGVRSSLEEDARRRVAKVMDANVREAGAKQVPSQRVIDLTGLHRPTAETCKDQVITGGIARMTVAPLALSDQCTLGQIAEMNGSAAPLGFGRDKDQATAGLPPQRSLDDQLSSLQIDIAPGESEGFT